MNRIDPKRHVAPGTGFHSIVGWTIFFVVGPLIVLGTILATYGIALIAWLIALLFYSSRINKARALLRGSAIQVGPSQLPEIYQAATEMSQALGLTKVPEVFVIEDNQQNAFALKHGKHRYVVLIDDIVHALTQRGNEGRALDWVIAHELAHHALGHTGFMRGLVRTWYRPLSRVDEFSCDSVAHALLQDTDAARTALAVLVAGPWVAQQIDMDALDQQARAVAADKHTKKAEAKLTHPLTLHRYAKILQARQAPAMA